MNDYWAKNDRIEAISLLKKSEKSLYGGLLEKDFAQDGRKSVPHVLMFLSHMKENPGLREMAYEEIRRMILDCNVQELRGKSPVHEQNIKVSMAARLNFAGVFTDIPPYCYENGGAVINSSILMDGEYPVRAVTGRHRGKGFIFECIDAVGNRSLVEYDVLNNGGKSENDMFSLHRAVCVATGAEGGVRLSLESKVPMGSGLGTSSIMAAAAIKALYVLYGHGHDDESIINKVLAVEQLIGTGGGWQDQCGGLFPGIKACYSNAGLPQDVKVEKIGMDLETALELENRLFVIYSGEKRNAGNILRRITDGYLLREKKVMDAFDEIGSLPRVMKEALENADLAGFARIMNRQAFLNKRLCGAHTDERLEGIIASLEPLCDGILVSGAGGGGYLAVLAKSAGYETFRRRMAEIDGGLIPIKVDMCMSRPSYKVETI